MTSIITPFLFVLALSLPLSEQRRPEPTGAAKGNTTKSAASSNQTANPAKTPVPPITVVVQVPPPDPAAQARQEERDVRTIRAAEHMVTLTGILIIATTITLAFIGCRLWKLARPPKRLRKAR